MGRKQAKPIEVYSTDRPIKDICNNKNSSNKLDSAPDGNDSDLESSTFNDISRDNKRPKKKRKSNKFNKKLLKEHEITDADFLQPALLPPKISMPSIRDNESFESFNRRVKEATQSQLTNLNEVGRLSHSKSISIKSEVEPSVKKLFRKIENDKRNKVGLIKDSSNSKVYSLKIVDTADKSDFAPRVIPKFADYVDAPPKLQNIPKVKKNLLLTSIVSAPAYVDLIKADKLQKDKEMVQLAYKNMKKKRAQSYSSSYSL